MSSISLVVNMIANVGTLLVLIFGGIKIYYVLQENPPHTHNERGAGTPLTTDGLSYPRGTKSNKTQA